MMNKQYKVLLAAALIIIVFVVAVVIFNEKQADKLSEAATKNASLLIRDYSPTLGNKNAKVTIVEFFDPACETCKAFYPLVKKIMSANHGRVKLVVRYLPLHKGSDYVCKILEAARLQNKFWPTLKAIYNSQAYWASHHNPQPDKLWNLLRNSGLNLTKAREDMLNQNILQSIHQDVADAWLLGVTKTPGFFVNGKPLVKFGYKQLQQLVDSEVRKNY